MSLNSQSCVAVKEVRRVVGMVVLVVVVVVWHAQENAMHREPLHTVTPTAGCPPTHQQKGVGVGRSFVFVRKLIKIEGKISSLGSPRRDLF